MHRCKRNLIETVAEEIAQELLQEQDKVTAVEVAVSKPNVSIPGHFDAMGVKIYRRRKYPVRHFCFVLLFEIGDKVRVVAPLVNLS
jgi:hypothetical protein